MQVDQIRCSEHPSQYLCNFCLKQGCLVGLCPQCICKHTEYHTYRGDAPNYEHIKQTYSKAKDKLNQYHECVKSQKNRLHKLVGDIDRRKKQIRMLILSVKDDVFAMVEKCFTEIEEQFEFQLQKQKESKGFHTPSRFQDINSQLNQQLNDIKTMKDQLKSIKLPQTVRNMYCNFLPSKNTNLKMISTELQKNQFFTPEMFYNQKLFVDIKLLIKKLLTLTFKSPLTQVRREKSLSPLQRPKSPINIYNGKKSAQNFGITLDSVYGSRNTAATSQSRFTVKSPQSHSRYDIRASKY